MVNWSDTEKTAIETAEKRQKEQFLYRLQQYSATELGKLAASGVRYETIQLIDTGTEQMYISLDSEKINAELHLSDGKSINIVDIRSAESIPDGNIWKQADQKLNSLENEHKYNSKKIEHTKKIEHLAGTFRKAAGHNQKRYVSSVISILKSATDDFCEDVSSAGINEGYRILSFHVTDSELRTDLKSAYTDFTLRLCEKMSMPSTEINKTFQIIIDKNGINEKLLTERLLNLKPYFTSYKSLYVFMSVLEYWSGLTDKSTEIFIRNTAIGRAMRVAAYPINYIGDSSSQLPVQAYDAILKDASGKINSRRKSSRFRITFINEIRKKWGLNNKKSAIENAKYLEILRIAGSLSSISNEKTLMKACLTDASLTPVLPNHTYRIEDKENNCIDIVKAIPETKNANTVCIDYFGNPDTVSAIPWSAWAWAADMEEDIKNYAERQSDAIAKECMDTVKSILKAERNHFPIFAKRSREKAYSNAAEAQLPFISIIKAAESCGKKAEKKVYRAYLTEIPETLGIDSKYIQDIAKNLSEQEIKTDEIKNVLQSVLETTEGSSKSGKAAIYNSLAAILYVQSDRDKKMSAVYSVLDDMKISSEYTQTTLDDFRFRQGTGKEEKKMEELSENILKDRAIQLKDTIFHKPPEQIRTKSKAVTKEINIQTLLEQALEHANKQGRTYIDDSDWKYISWDTNIQKLITISSIADLYSSAALWCAKHNASLKFQEDIAKKLSSAIKPQEKLESYKQERIEAKDQRRVEKQNFRRKEFDFER